MEGFAKENNKEDETNAICQGCENTLPGEKYRGGQAETHRDDAQGISRLIPQAAANRKIGHHSRKVEKQLRNLTAHQELTQT